MTDRYAVIGNPIEHSKSPLIHTAFARQTGQDIEYGRILAPLDDFAAVVDEFRSSGGKGLNVTVPFKEDAFRYAARLSARAEKARAVNTLHFLDDGAVFGDTTDGPGLARDIQANLHFSLRGKRILLMGAGGAARGVIQPLLDEAPTALTVVNRTTKKARELAQAFSAINGVGYEELSGQTYDVVINASASSLHNDLPPLPAGIFASGALAYDMMYGRETPFMQFARNHGAGIIADGLGMLVEQAAESFFIWRGVRPDTAPVLAQLRNT
ncbi:MAG: shikimate dehydrogenase [Nitrosomonadales bacterium]|nr:MAG: shikimate dehydrogenase [Nitrosomonadales bacterium]